ncbi:hypothetical protein Tco_0317806 [Tanacetum coccineum]
MHTIGMTMQQVQVNTKFLNALSPEWSKFITSVKLAKSLYTTNYDQLYAYLSQHERHANEVRIMRERYPDPLALVANSQTLYNPSQSLQHSAEFLQLDYGLVVPTFRQGEDPIDCINKAMSFLSAVESRFPPSNNQLRTSSNPRNQATIQDERVTVQQVQGRQNLSFAGTGNRDLYNSRRNMQMRQQRYVKVLLPKLMLAKAQGAGQILDEEQLAFISDPRIAEVQVAQQTIPQNLAFQTEDLDSYDLYCDDISLAKSVLMVNLSSCDPDVLSDVLIMLKLYMFLYALSMILHI